MSGSILASLPLAAVIAALASVVVTMWREKAVLRREERMVQLQIRTKLQESKLTRLLDAQANIPVVKKQYSRSATGEITLNFERLHEDLGNFVQWVRRIAIPLLSKERRAALLPRLEEVEAALLSAAEQFAQGAEVITIGNAASLARQVSDTVTESIQMEIDQVFEQENSTASNLHN